MKPGTFLRHHSRGRTGRIDKIAGELAYIEWSDGDAGWVHLAHVKAVCAVVS